ncbi:glycosyltransferase family 2 protein [Salinigranum halophilum]|uniref:glycosyltransferase family 2 protein n=1 Tax=Salinigranum halophilum TaxID=2565931 RepID=UPI001F4892C6|nr:glycosyltransferase family 2 protein [Salinigranum halophilum]
MSVDESDRTPPLVSVVVPTYGRPEYLLEALESILEQTYEPIELVVVDDHSPESVSEHLEKHSFDPDDRFECIRHEENLGGNAARNTGIRNTNGEYVAFLDDDDFWNPKKIERQVTAFEELPDSVGVVYTGTHIVDGAGRVVRTSIPDTPTPRSVTRDLLLGETVAGSFSKVMVDATAIEEVGLPDERFPSWQDREWYLRLSRRYLFKAICEPLVYYRIADHDQIGDDFEEKRDVTYPLFFEKHRETAAELGDSMEQRFAASLAQSIAVAALKHGYYRDAFKHFGISVERYPFVLQSYLSLFVANGGSATYKLVHALGDRLQQKWQG